MKVSTTSPFFSVALLVISMLSIQCSASLAKSVFPIIGPEATTALRLMFAALVLLPVMRPWRAKLTRKQWLPIILYGLSTGVMNMCFYQAISRIPLGVGVALEFTGPLAIAMLGSRRLIDFLWIALAVGGLILLLPIHEFSGNLDPVGVAFALGAGFCWAMYIFFGKRAGNAGGGASVSLGMIVGACAIMPFGVASAGTSMFSMSVLPLALLLGGLGQMLHQGGFAASRPAFDEKHLHPGLPAQRFKITLEARRCGGPQKEIGRTALDRFHIRTPHFCFRVCKNEGR